MPGLLSHALSALGKVAKLYQQAAVDIPNEDQAVLWYSLAKDASPSYQDAYDAALQAQFNAQQLRQIEALKQQEQANAPRTVTHIPSPESTSSDWRWLIHATYLVIIGSIIMLGVYLRQRATHASNDTKCVPSPRNARDAAVTAFTAPKALRSIQGT